MERSEHDKWVQKKVLEALRALEEKGYTEADQEIIRKQIQEQEGVFVLGSPFILAFVDLIKEDLITARGMGNNPYYSLTEKGRNQEKNS